MAYGHAERNLAAVRRLALETLEFLGDLPRLDSEQVRWMRDVNGGTHPEVLTDLVPEHAVQDAARQTVDRQLADAALRTLSIEHRQALFETYFRGASVAEAAGTLGVPPGTVKSRTHYALHALRQEIDETRDVGKHRPQLTG